MKVIKQYFKVVLCFVAFAVLSFVFAINPSLSAYASLSYAEAAVITAMNAEVKDFDFVFEFRDLLI